ncbi:MAG: sodium-dependent bicarbonate transport family permease [Tateyamaria sp.]|uniref:sodium-dependent bicarbonate transport family permease n=1 Tax=Tateyamaria sp. TaxID=1929288 RepID=UPI00329A8317
MRWVWQRRWRDSNLSEAVAKGMSIYLLFAIAFEGGVSIADYGVDVNLALSLVAGLVLSAILPLISFTLLQVMGKPSRMAADLKVVCSPRYCRGLLVQNRPWQYVRKQFRQFLTR